MSYCTVGNVKSYFLGKTFLSTDYVTEDNVNDFISDDASMIDASVRVKYPLPITNADDLRILKQINTKMVVGTIDEIFREKTADGELDRTRGLRKEALDMLRQIRDGEIILNGSQNSSLIKFNSTRSDGESVVTRFKDENIDKDF